MKTLHVWHCGRGTVILGFEQTNKYTVLDQDGNTVALMAEDTGGLGTAVGRQFLRRRRSFTATVFSPDGGTLKVDAYVFLQYRQQRQWRAV